MKIDVKIYFCCLVLCGVFLAGCQSNSSIPSKSEDITDEQENTGREGSLVKNETKENETKDKELKIDEELEIGISQDMENDKKATTADVNKNQITNKEQLLEHEEQPNEEINEDKVNMETKILVYKEERKLELWLNGELTNSYSIGLAKNAEGRKQKEGDRLTPEGEYYVCTRNQYSKFYLSLGVSYPNIEDAKNGLESGLIDDETYEQIENAIQKKECPPWYTALGGEIMIHGHGGDKDWTKGCIAVDDEVMDVLWEVCQLGTLIVIYP